MSDRPPRDLRGLLKFCAEYTKTEDAPLDSNAEPLDPERAEFLQQVLKNLSVDVIKEFTEAIRILTDPKVYDSSATDVDEQVYALECIEDWVGQIDMAINFHKVGGFEAILHALNSPHASLRAQAAHLIAELSQNNPYCQEHLMKDGFIQILLRLMDSESEAPQVRVKALYGISCIIRQCSLSTEEWIRLEGPSILIRALMTDIPKLKIKASFLLSSLIAENPTRFAPLFSSMGTHLQLGGLIAQGASNEQVALALFTLLSHTEDPSTLSELAENSELKSSLKKYIKDMKGKEECLEELEFYQKIHSLCFQSSEPSSIDR